MSDFKDNTVYLCVHCGTQCGKAKYCKNCDSAPKRAEMDKENKKIKADNVCKVCDLGWYSVFTQVHEELTIEKFKG